VGLEGDVAASDSNKDGFGAGLAVEGAGEVPLNQPEERGDGRYTSE
jgi:hypothetical protein